MNAATNTASSDETLESDVQSVIGGAEDLLRQAARTGGEKATELRERALEQLEALRVKLREANTAVVERSREAARATDEYVHDNPWRVIVGAAGVGVLIGLLIARR
jgi:ElaB/YqjD/DUF883 family membrane-anchored ribosome-binding protein